MMMKKMTQRAQTVGEYAVIIALVIGVATAMSMMVRRGLQARLRDANKYMMVTVDGAYQASRGAGEATPSSVGAQYEPYYSETNSTVIQEVDDLYKLLPAPKKTGIFRILFNQSTTVNTTGEQAPPGSAY